MKRILLLFTLLFAASGAFAQQSPTITIGGAAQTGVGYTTHSAAQRMNTALSLVRAYQAATNNSLGGMYYVRFQWADGYTETYRFLAPDELLLLPNRLEYPSQMVNGGAGSYRYFGSGVWARWPGCVAGCTVYTGTVTVGDVIPPPGENEEP